MRVAIYGRGLKEAALPAVMQLFDLLQQYKVEYILHEAPHRFLSERGLDQLPTKTFSQHTDLLDGVDVLICIGGDGTILDALTLVKNSGIPVMGINFGRLGFLADISKHEIELAIQAMVQGNYELDRRTVLELTCDHALFEGSNYALNEFTIQRKESSSMITVHTYLNGELLNSYWADGLIVSTPTGSTGYSLSCGGPIIHPSAQNFVLTPVAPHNLNVRPMVVSDDYVISFEVEGKGPTNSFLATLDSRFETIDSSYNLAVKKADFTLNLMRISDEGFLNAIRAKLLWGADRRN